jgi:hypothetical protein
MSFTQIQAIGRSFYLLARHFDLSKSKLEYQKFNLSSSTDEIDFDSAKLETFLSGRLYNYCHYFCPSIELTLRPKHFWESLLPFEALLNSAGPMNFAITSI